MFGSFRKSRKLPKFRNAFQNAGSRTSTLLEHSTNRHDKKNICIVYYIRNGSETSASGQKSVPRFPRISEAFRNFRNFDRKGRSVETGQAPPLLETGQAAAIAATFGNTRSHLRDRLAISEVSQSQKKPRLRVKNELGGLFSKLGENQAANQAVSCRFPSSKQEQSCTNLPICSRRLCAASMQNYI